MRISFLSASIWALATLPQLASSIFVDEVGNIDFHYNLIGLPKPESTFFHKPTAEANRTLLYTVSDVGVLGALLPSDGSVLWRQYLAQDGIESNGLLKPSPGEASVVSAYGSKVQTWSAFHGRNIWTREADGSVVDIAIASVAIDGRKDVFSLSKSPKSFVVSRLNSLDGSLVWSTQLDEGLNAQKLVISAEKLFVIGLSKSGVSVIPVDVSSNSISPEIVFSKSNQVPRILFVGGSLTQPIMVWSHDIEGVIYVNTLGSSSKAEIALSGSASQVNIRGSVSTGSKTYILVDSKTGKDAQVYEIGSSSVTKAYTLPGTSGMSIFSAAAVGDESYFVRATIDKVALFSWENPSAVFEWPLVVKDNKVIVDSISEVIKSSSGFNLSVAGVSSNHEWILLNDGQEAWSRVEGLSSTVAAAFANIPEDEHIAKALDQEAHTNPVAAYMHRATRHLEDLQHLPAYLQSLPDKLISAVYGKPSVAPGTRDSFGFHKILIVATSRGRVYALDTGSRGRVMWTRQVIPYTSGQTWDVIGLYADDTRHTITVMDTTGVSFTLSTVDGSVADSGAVGQPRRVQGSVLVHGNGESWILPVFEGGVLPDLVPSKVLNETVVVRGLENDVKGVKYTDDGSSHVIWSFLPPPGFTIAKVSHRDAHDPVASIGRVLGDRSVLYKYLNQNTILITLTNSEESTLINSLIDTISGQVIFSSTHKGVDVNKEFDCVLSENWMACTFFAKYVVQDGTGRVLNGVHLVMTDLYESNKTNDRGPLGMSEEASMLSPYEVPNTVGLPHAVSQAYIISTPITALAVSQTRQGITRRQILAHAPDLHSVFGLPREMFDPRRPVGRDPSKDEFEAESLPRYTANIELDPKTTLSHVREVIGITGILSIPTNMESTSLLVSYGVDLFSTRLSPSMQFDVLGRGFDRVSLVGTCLALFGGVIALKPLVVNTPLFRDPAILSAANSQTLRGSREERRRPENAQVPTFMINAEASGQGIRCGDGLDSVALSADANKLSASIDERRMATLHSRLTNLIEESYATISIIEARCAGTSAPQPESSASFANGRWRTLHKLHSNLISAYHTFFAITQDRYATTAMRRLPLAYEMPRRLWEIGMYSLLEPMRLGLPDSREHMHHFWAKSYGMMCLMLETMGAFRLQWTEVLGALSRYRVFIEEGNGRDAQEGRMSWVAVARSWYCLALDLAPGMGRLYASMGLLSLTSGLERLFYYLKALCVQEPHADTQGRLVGLFDAVAATTVEVQGTDLPPVETAFVCMHGILYRLSLGECQPADVELWKIRVEEKQREFLAELKQDIVRNPIRWARTGAFVALINIFALYEYRPQQGPRSSGQSTNSLVFSIAVRIFILTLQTILDSTVEPCCFSFLHSTFAYLAYSVDIVKCSFALYCLPWPLVISYANALQVTINSAYANEMTQLGHLRSWGTLAEDYSIRGFEFAECYFQTPDWVAGSPDESERLLEHPQAPLLRTVRIVSLLRVMADRTQGRFMTMNATNLRWELSVPLAIAVAAQMSRGSYGRDPRAGGTGVQANSGG
ncbi:hypothetical protein Cpir12675_003589 [Ceratocystis pirilliformis]|uniref:ER membrane protein complex subunit 1 n=1 Tax=Ceratocystis pirilliformis TaxID=259994 RepID=A0ABR3Z2X0_9PEZI